MPRSIHFNSHLVGRTSLRAAGQNKDRNYDLVYSGGLIAALALDAMIISSTDGVKSVADLLRTLYRDFGLTGKMFTLTDVGKAATLVAGRDMNPFFTSYVAGLDTIPLKEYLNAVGLDLTTESGRGVLARRPNPALSEQRRLSTLLASSN
jgi:predicted metalloprotease with PDZ domain